MRSSPAEIWIWYLMSTLSRWLRLQQPGQYDRQHLNIGDGWTYIPFELGKDAIRMLQLVIIQPLS
jgi:hypothetical protein